MKYVFLFPVIGVLVSASLGAPMPVTQDFLIETLEAAVWAVNDLTVEYELVVEYSDIVAKTEEARTPGHEFLLIKGPMKCQLSVRKPFSEFYRMQVSGVADDTRGRTGRDERVTTYNGKVGKTSQASEILGKPGRMDYRGRIANSRTEEVFINATPIGYIAGFHQEAFNGRTVTLPEYLRLVRDTSETDRLEFRTDIQRVDDCNTVSIWHWRRLKANDGDYEVDLLIARYYFSLEHDLSLVMKEAMSGEEVAWRQNVLRFERLTNGIWFPSECSFRELAADGTSYTIRVSKVIVNQGLTEKDFDITFPPGTRVSDEITGKTYVVKPTQEQLDESLPKP